MQERVFCDHTYAVIHTLCFAKRKLESLSGMLAIDTTAPQKSFVIDTSEAVMILDEALKDLKKSKVYEMGD